jgi:peptide/nickel transport system substrate-binding protein
MRRSHVCLLILFVLMNLLFLTLPACSKKTMQTGKSPKAATKKHPPRLVLATNSEPDTLNPLFAEMAASYEIIFLGQRELTMNDDKWRLVADLAQEIPTPENGQVKLINTTQKDKTGRLRQKMVITWHIKKDALWEDGVPVTANDLIFAWKVCLDPAQEIVDRDTCERVESMEADKDDPKTLIVTWKEPFAFYNTYRVHTILPAHILGPRYQKPGGGTNDMKKDTYGKRPLSNGPFKFKEWVPGQYITYVRNDKYKPLAKLEEITFRIIPNNMSIESNLISGTIDGTIPSGGLNVPSIEMLKKQHGDQFQYYLVNGLVWTHIDFNLDSTILSDIRVRRALAHALNRRQIIKTIYYNKYELAYTFEPPLHWGYNKTIPEITFDLKKSAELFDAAGWKQTAPGEIRKNTKGEPLRIKMSAVAAIKDTEQFQQVFQSDLRSIGVDLQVDNKPAKVFFGDLARYRKFPHLSFYSWVSGPESWSHTLWHKNFIPSAKNNWQGQNYPGWVNEEASKLLEEIPTILNESQRVKMLQQVQQIWFDDLPAIPVYFRPVVAVTCKGLQNYKLSGTQTPVSWNAWEWSF